ncbi:Calcium-dependent protein kinase 1 [Triticum urartu]|uniref:non-specific serine/threonine protein kinase n=2 Tax=Triticum TaxID=4564 RepID=A0A9R0YB78_TRITD|nr:Calcium-dependent protein kinase 1 [Triticum urartu]VAI52224.1 unnamed protein product [Triticum turgidum subsp. durum]
MGHQTPLLRDLYNVGRKLGQGQFGTTYLCTEISTGVDFACKSIAKRKLLTPEDVEDVRREIQIMHHLAGHDSVVTIKGAYEDAQFVHIVMELCEGGELFDRIVQRGYFSERRAAEIARVIVGVVEACHSLGVMHRDLKPENFLLKDKEENNNNNNGSGNSVNEPAGDKVNLKAIDFGLSVFFKPGQIFTDVVGSPYYVAPEVLCKHYGPEADEQVLCHPWIIENGEAPDAPLDPAVLSRLKQFSAMNRLKKMALRVIARGLSEEELAGLKEMFKTMDTDGSGAITFEELREGLRRYGSTELRDSEVRDLMEAADVDNSGTIDYDEFIAATVHMNKLDREEHLMAAFSYFDKDGSGYITVDELEVACREHNMADVGIDDIIREVDQDNDGRIDYGEFVAMMKKGIIGNGRLTMRHTSDGSILHGAGSGLSS